MKDSQTFCQAPKLQNQKLLIQAGELDKSKHHYKPTTAIKSREMGKHNSDQAQQVRSLTLRVQVRRELKGAEGGAASARELQRKNGNPTQPKIKIKIDTTMKKPSAYLKEERRKSTQSTSSMTV
mgnify:CR=1 FL=1